MSLYKLIERGKFRLALAALIVGLGLTACASEAPAVAGEAAELKAGDNYGSSVEAVEDLKPNTDEGSQLTSTLPGTTLMDRQGAVEVAVTPLADLSNGSGRLVFEVAMNTHSVDLSMNLAELAVLETDNGLSMPAASWSGGSGHHVTGYLEFDLPQGEEFDQLTQAAQWVLTIQNVDAAERVYIWEIG